jgi:hypothetical protein
MEKNIVGWFNRHLNWTCVFVGICAWVLAWYLVELILFATGMVYLTFPGQPYEAPSPFSSSNTITFNIQAMSDIATVISMPIFLWILRKKSRSWKYLLVFVPPLIPAPNAGFVLWFLVPFWLYGWIILLALRNKSAL